MIVLKVITFSVTEVDDRAFEVLLLCIVMCLSEHQVTISSHFVPIIPINSLELF